MDLRRDNTAAASFLHKVQVGSWLTDFGPLLCRAVPFFRRNTDPMHAKTIVGKLARAHLNINLSKLS